MTRPQAQIILDTLFECIISMLKNETNYSKCSAEDIAEYCRRQLSLMGIETVPKGMSWAVLVQPRENAKCTSCKFIGEKYWDGDDLEEAGYECKWPAKGLPPSLKWANRERVSVRPSDAVNCSYYEEKDENPWEIIDANRPE